jgi:hypothetical protein
MQQDARFITADFLYMFRASCAHHQECKILTRQPPVQVVMVAGGSSLRHVSLSRLSVIVVGGGGGSSYKRVSDSE